MGLNLKIYKSKVIMNGKKKVIKGFIILVVYISFVIYITFKL